jgi:AcrR family transcriptional regulator
MDNGIEGGAGAHGKPPGRSRYRKLKPGPGRHPEEVAAHQRGRLQAAMIELVAEAGYDAVSIAAVSRHAGVSKRDFYRQFESKEACFLATYDEIVRTSLKGIITASAGESEWQERVRLGFLAFANQVADNPEAARLALIDVFAAGPLALERTLHTNGLFETMIAKDFAHAEGGAQLPPLVVKGIVAGGNRVARVRLLSDHPRRLTLDWEKLMAWSLSFCDDAVVRLGDLGEPDAVPLPDDEKGDCDPPPCDERTLILAVTARLASESGFIGLTVPRIRESAGISRQSFDAHFESVTDCFLAAIDLLCDRALAGAAPASLGAEDWPTTVHRTIVALCRQLALDPPLAKLVFHEIFAPGPEAICWRTTLIARLGSLLRHGAPPGNQPSEFAAGASVGAIWGVIQQFVLAGRVSLLPKAAPTLSYIALAPALGGAQAVEAILAAEEAGAPDLDRRAA